MINALPAGALKNQRLGSRPRGAGGREAVSISVQIALVVEVARLRAALEIIAAPMRPDGTWNRDREACRELAERVLRDELVK